MGRHIMELTLYHVLKLWFADVHMRPLRQYRGSPLRMCSEMHYGIVRLQTKATTWFSGPVASHNELTMFQFCNLFTHSWNYFMGCYTLLWTPGGSRPNWIMWLWCSLNQIPCLGKAVFVSRPSPSALQSAMFRLLTKCSMMYFDRRVSAYVLFG